MFKVLPLIMQDLVSDIQNLRGVEAVRQDNLSPYKFYSRIADFEVLGMCIFHHQVFSSQAVNSLPMGFFCQVQSKV